MTTLTVNSISKGIAIGRLKTVNRVKADVSCNEAGSAAGNISRRGAGSVTDEISRYESAMKTAQNELHEIAASASEYVDEKTAEIVAAQIVMLADEKFKKSVCEKIVNNSCTAEDAISETCSEFVKVFEALEDENIQARATDVKDVAERIIRALNNDKERPLDKDCDEQPSDKGCDEATILIGDFIYPSEILRLGHKVLALVSREGSANSHTAIIARSMGIPALMGPITEGVESGLATEENGPFDDCRFDSLKGKIAIVDGYEGKLIIDPSEAFLEEYRHKMKSELERKKTLESLRGKTNVTMSGKEIDILANIGSIEDLNSVLENDAGGIGLFRTEFLYLEKGAYPTEEEQFDVYKKVLLTMKSKPVIVRTFDIGADKSINHKFVNDSLTKKDETENANLRGIALSLANPDSLKKQLRALYRASIYGNLSIMYPMITGLDEVHKIKEISKSVRDELVERGVKIGDVREGIMIETPEAVRKADELAKEVDFFSIGSNDLTQYALEIDRLDSQFAQVALKHRDEIMDMIGQTVESGHKRKIKVGICGEMAADPDLTETFIDMGIDSLSISPSLILEIRNTVRNSR